MPTEREATYYGLINQGATCYLNSILQVLFRTKEFKDAVNRSEEVKDQYIDRHLKDLFKNLQDKKTNARKIIEALGIKREYEQQDAAEYFEKILRLTSDDAAKTFRGQLSHRTTCCKCHKVNDSFGHFWHLPLELLNSRGIYSVVCQCTWTAPQSRPNMPTEREATYYGLINQGATCYLNSILQVLFRTKEFKDAVNRSEEVKDQYIDRHLKDLFKNLQDKKTNARKIIEALGIKREYEQQDAAEYFEKILRLTSDDAAKTFRGQLSHRTTCCKCHKVNDSFGHFWHLPLELLNSRGIYSVENGINDFFKPTVFNEENQMYCDKCDEKVDAHRQYVITHHPDVLLLLLKRFDFSYQYMSYVKINCSVEFPYKIKIPEKQIYELYSVVEHFGDLRSGQYWATIKSQEEENLWYTFNDTNVSQIVPNKCPGNDNIARSSSAYLLFYRKKGTEEKVENSVFQPPGMETNINKHERVKSNATRSTTDKDFAVSKVSSTQTDNLPDPAGNITEENGNIMVYQHEEHDRDINLPEHKDRNRGTTDQASHERKKQNTAHFQPEQSQNLVMPVDDMNVSQRPYEENIGKNKNIDGTEKHQTENSHVECTTVRNPNTAEQGEYFLPPNYQIQQNEDKNTNKSINIQANSNGVVKPDERKTDPTYNQPETTHANLNKNKQTREREEHINQPLSVASDHVPQSNQGGESKQTDLKDQALAAEHLQMSDKRSRKTTSKAKEVNQDDATEAGYQPKHDHIDCSSINKGQTQNNGNTNRDYNSGVIRSRKTQPMIQSTRDKCALDKRRNTKEDDGTMKEDGLKTHAKGQVSNEDTDDSPRQSGSRNEERQAGKQVAEGDAEISTANTSKGLKGNRKIIFKIIEEKTETLISYKGISRETSVKEISQGIITKKGGNSVGHQINEEQGQLMVDENQKRTTRLAKKFKMFQVETSLLKKIPDAELDAAGKLLRSKKRNRFKRMWLGNPAKKTQPRRKGIMKKKRRKE